MSYDLAVLDKHKRFKTEDEFLKWYDQVMEWAEDIDYNDYRNATLSLQSSKSGDGSVIRTDQGTL